jgi:pimeloyl-ACP methyl ester carboxylesterase
VTESEVFFVDNGAGFDLALKRVTPKGRATRGRPAVIVPGYGMNAFIFGFHPSGRSMEEYLAAEGLEVWSIDLRGQGRTRDRASSSCMWGLAELTVDDLGVAIRGVLERTKTGATEVDLVGCSLGTTLAFAHVACVPDAPVRCLVSMGGLVTWVKVHPLLKVAFASPWLVSKVKLRGTRKLARALLPAIGRHVPWALSFYIHGRSTDLSHADAMVQTVEDPVANVNRDIAEWIAKGDLIMRGVNVSRRVPEMRHPLLCIVANNDGIVPPETARWTYESTGATDRVLVCVGDRDTPIAHADLFVSHVSQEKVFAPLARFLNERG